MTDECLFRFGSVLKEFEGPFDLFEPSAMSVMKMSSCIDVVDTKVQEAWP